jgi:phosphoenolpyruvate carboxykinase (ATP)
VNIPTSSAIVKAIAEGTITWSDDDDFGYLVAESVPGIDDPELLQPRRLYERHGRIQDYRDFVERFKAERVEFLKGFPALDEEIIKAVG